MPTPQNLESQFETEADLSSRSVERPRSIEEIVHRIVGRPVFGGVVYLVSISPARLGALQEHAVHHAFRIRIAVAESNGTNGRTISRNLGQARSGPAFQLAYFVCNNPFTMNRVLYLTGFS